jgi:hypothetical protein
MAMTGFPEDLRAVLRALAEARDGPFYRLYVDLTYAWPGPYAGIGFRIYQVADSPDVLLGVSASVQRPNAPGVAWSVVLKVSPHRLSIEGAVEVDEESGSVKEVFSLNTEAATAAEAADLVSRYSEEVCAQRAWIGYGGAS